MTHWKEPAQLLDSDNLGSDSSADISSHVACGPFQLRFAHLWIWVVASISWLFVELKWDDVCHIGFARSKSLINGMIFYFNYI